MLWVWLRLGPLILLTGAVVSLVEVLLLALAVVELELLLELRSPRELEESVAFDLSWVIRLVLLLAWSGSLPRPLVRVVVRLLSRGDSSPGVLLSDFANSVNFSIMVALTESIRPQADPCDTEVFGRMAGNSLAQ